MPLFMCSSSFNAYWLRNFDVLSNVLFLVSICGYFYLDLPELTSHLPLRPPQALNKKEHKNGGLSPESPEPEDFLTPRSAEPKYSKIEEEYQVLMQRSGQLNGNRVSVRPVGNRVSVRPAERKRGEFAAS